MKKKATPKALPEKNDEEKHKPNQPNNTPKKTQKTPEPSGKQLITNKALINALFESFAPDTSDEAKKKRDQMMSSYLKQNIQKHAIAKAYNLLILYDEGKMIKSDADNIYSSARKFTEKKPLLLVIHSGGGYTGPAYLIGKLCQEYSNDNLVIVVPRRAKSGATLICCAGNKIHMGSLSELGPIDPQIDKSPALGLKSAIEHIADLIQKYPHSANMFAKYLYLSVPPMDLGYCERVAESAVQYAERLLKPHEGILKDKASKIAKTLVYSYKDHGFVIDKTEAREIFGNKIVCTNTEEYDLGNAIYNTMNFFSGLSDIMEHRFYFIGAVDSEPKFLKKTK